MESKLCKFNINVHCIFNLNRTVINIKYEKAKHNLNVNSQITKLANNKNMFPFQNVLFIIKKYKNNIITKYITRKKNKNKT